MGQSGLSNLALNLKKRADKSAIANGATNPGPGPDGAGAPNPLDKANGGLGLGSLTRRPVLAPGVTAADKLTMSAQLGGPPAPDALKASSVAAKAATDAANKQRSKGIAFVVGKPGAKTPAPTLAVKSLIGGY